ncbi:MAG: hypothetical protein NW223_03715 [Hyphomicrobiaceae bacterium]|nr:hypothetical protein [Hyphomicrobiaceae bacterium]
MAEKEPGMRELIIGALLVAVAVLGYWYWESQSRILIKAPGVEIKAG